jgi:hypothetical protein
MAWRAIRLRLDRVGIVLSGLCALHCLLGIALISLFGLSSLAGEELFAPSIHRIGLALAVAIGAVTLGLGVLRHGRGEPLLIGGLGLALMTGALFAPHGVGEAGLTIAGVALVAYAHIRNLRHAA